MRRTPGSPNLGIALQCAEVILASDRLFCATKGRSYPDRFFGFGVIVSDPSQDSTIVLLDIDPAHRVLPDMSSKTGSADPQISEINITFFQWIGLYAK